MKKFICGFLCCAVLCSLFVFAGISAANSPIKLIINGKEIQCDVPPQIINGRVMVPARYVAENLGATTTWNQNQNAIIVSTGFDDVQTSWIKDTNVFLLGTRDLEKEFKVIANDDSLSLLDICNKTDEIALRINPILQGALGYLPPDNKKEAYNYLIEYIKASEGYYNAYAYWAMTVYYDSPQNRAKATTYKNKANYYHERMNAMHDAFIRYR